MKLSNWTGIFVATAVLAVVSTTALALTPKEAASKLRESVVAFDDPTKSMCTAWKVDTRKFVTAAHCLMGITPATKLVYERTYMSPYFIEYAVTKKLPDNKRRMDWGVINTFTDDNPNLKSLEVDCKRDLELGDEVAYFGYSSPTKGSFGVGYVASLAPTNRTVPNQADFLVDLQAAPGASGSPIVALDTGKVIGILTEGVQEQRAGVFLIGAESIKNTRFCWEYEPTLEVRDPDHTTVLPNHRNPVYPAP